MSELISLKIQEPSSYSTNSFEDSRPITPVKPNTNPVEEEDDQDDIQPDKELVFKLQCLKNSLTPKMRVLIEEKRDEIDNEPLLENELEAERKGISFKLLRELKVAFESVISSSGLAGVDETEFLELFGEHLCAGMSEEETRHWFRCVDQNCSGSIQWGEVTQYLIGFDANKRPVSKNYFVDRTMEPGGTLVTRRKHCKPISKIVFSKDSDTFYTAAPDGCVYCWSPTTFKVLQVVHQNAATIEDIVFIPHNNRLLVLQSDRCVFLYDCFMRDNVLCHELNRVFATKGYTTKTLSDGNSYYSAVTKEDLQGDPKTVHLSAISDRALPHMILCTLLQVSKNRYTCADHLGGGLTAGEPIVFGTDAGTLEVQTLIGGGTIPLKTQLRVSVHKGVVTKVVNAPELTGVLSSSTDHTVALTDVEKGVVIQRVKLHEHSRPIYSFDYHTYHNTLLTWGGRELHLWNALTGAKLSSFSEHDSPIVSAVLNVERMHVYVLTESKTIKVWDIRTWKHAGEYYDTFSRYPTDKLSFVFWSKEHYMLVSGCGELFGLRPADVQERIDAGLRASNVGYVGHMHPIRASKALASAGHIVSMDLQNVGVWGFSSRQLLSLWKWNSATDHITCFDTSKDEVKVLIGTEEGKVGWYNYACGFRMYSLLHKKGNVAVNAVLVVSDLAPNLPEVGIAAVGSSLFLWESNTMDKDVKYPHEVFEHPDEDAIAMCLTIVDSSRQFIACGFSNSEVKIFTYFLVPLFTLAVSLPVEHLLAVTRGAFFGTHNDGFVTLFGIDPRSYDLHALFTFQASLVDDEHVTCIAVQDNLLIVGDNLGVVTIFDFGQLLEPSFLKGEILAALQEKNFVKTIQEAVRRIELVCAFDAHEGAVTGLSLCKGEIITSGGDRHLRSWSIEKHGLITEYGMTDANTQPFYSFNVTAEHAFNRKEIIVKGQSKLTKRKITRALSFTKRGSLLGVELRKKRLAKLEAKKAVKEAQPKKPEVVSVTGLGVAPGEGDDESSSSSDESDMYDPWTDASAITLPVNARFSSFVFGKEPERAPDILSATTPQAKTPQPTKSNLGQHLGLGLLSPFAASQGRGNRSSSSLNMTISEARSFAASPNNASTVKKMSASLNNSSIMSGSMSMRLPQKLPELPKMVYEKPKEMDLFKLATDRIIKIRHNLTRNIPDEATHQKLQEVMRIREERLTEQVKSSGIFYRLDMEDVHDVLKNVHSPTLASPVPKHATAGILSAAVTAPTDREQRSPHSDEDDEIFSQLSS